MRQGDRVMTPLGAGGVAYTRGFVHQGMHTINAVSVVLDSRRADVNYTGTIFCAADIAPCPLADLAAAIDQAPKVAEAPFTLTGETKPRDDGTQVGLFDKENP